MAGGVRLTKPAAKRIAAGVVKIEKFNRGEGVRHKRARFPRGEQGSSLAWGVVTSAASPGTLATPTIGEVQLYKKNSGGTGYEADGDPVEFWNVYPLTFDVSYIGKFDDSVDPVEVVVATCVPAE